MCPYSTVADDFSCGVLYEGPYWTKPQLHVEIWSDQEWSRHLIVNCHVPAWITVSLRGLAWIIVGHATCECELSWSRSADITFPQPKNELLKQWWPSGGRYTSTLIPGQFSLRSICCPPVQHRYHCSTICNGSLNLNHTVAHAVAILTRGSPPGWRLFPQHSCQASYLGS